MAGGKVSARQKMINLMYLVFIAMLAMNMSKEVLSAFGFMNEGITESNMSVTQKNTLNYADLVTKAQEQPEKYKELNDKATQIKNLSSDLDSFIEDIKQKMTAELENKKSYESMDKTDFLDNYFFKGDKYSAQGSEFLDKINNYRNQVIAILGSNYKDIQSTIEKRFDTGEQINKDKKKVAWLKYRFEGFPMVASLTNFTQLQAHIKNTESDILTAMMGGQSAKDASLTNYNGIVILDKNAFYPNEKVTGKVVLGRYDPTLRPTKVKLNGKDYQNFKDGEVILNMTAGSVGEKDISGTIFFTEDGKDIPVNFESSYSVIARPNDAVISADKMNVVYRGLDNPISVSLPGVPDKDISVSAPGSSLRKTGNGKFIMRPGSGNSVNINVSAKLNDGNTINSTTTYRIKDVPAAMGSVRGKFGIVDLPKSSAARAVIEAGLPDFLFDLELQVNSFKMKVPDKPTVLVTGNKLDAKAQSVLSSAKRGDMVTFFDIKATIVGNSSYQLKSVIPLSIQITN